jgi:hypothetical protein
MSGILSAASKATMDGFVGMSSSERKRDAYVEFLANMLAFVIALVLLSLIGKYIWNNVIVDLFSFAKPAKSFWQIIGLMIFVALVRP